MILSSQVGAAAQRPRQDAPSRALPWQVHTGRPAVAGPWRDAPSWRAAPWRNRRDPCRTLARRSPGGAPALLPCGPPRASSRPARPRRTWDHDRETAGPGTAAMMLPHRREKQMLVAFSVTPLGVGEAVADYVADAVRVVRESGLDNRTDAMFTTIEGDWDEVMDVVKRAVDAVAAVAAAAGAPAAVAAGRRRAGRPR